MKQQETFNRTPARQIRRSGFHTAVQRAVLLISVSYGNFLPAIAWTWFAAEIINPALDYHSPIGLLLLLPTGLVCYAAAATKAVAPCQKGVMRLYFTHFSSVLDYYWLYSLYLICCLLLTIILSFFGNINTGGFISDMLPMYALLFISMLTRVWPMIAIPFLYANNTQWESVTGKISSLTRAWSLTRGNDILVHTTIPLFMTGGILFGINLILKSLTTSLIAGLVLDLLLYAITLPFYITLIIVLVEEIAAGSRQSV